jgi:protease I
VRRRKAKAISASLIIYIDFNQGKRGECMAGKLTGKKIAILVADGFEQIEMTAPRKALEIEGAVTHIISPNTDMVKGWQYTDWGDFFDVDVTLRKADANNYQALLLPGGVMNPDKLRIDEDAVAFVAHFVRDGKPIAAVCHGPWTLIETGFVKGRTMTSWPSLKTDLRNAGATWVDKEVVVDNGLITSRKPDDISAFNEKMIKEFVQGVHMHQHFAA